MIWHLDVVALTRRICDNVKLQIWQFLVFFLWDVAGPEWLIWLADDTVLLFEEFHKFYERFIWDQSETHTIVNNKLLRISSKSLPLTNINILRTKGPVLLIV